MYWRSRGIQLLRATLARDRPPDVFAERHSLINDRNERRRGAFPVTWVVPGMSVEMTRQCYDPGNVPRGVSSTVMLGHVLEGPEL